MADRPLGANAVIAKELPCRALPVACAVLRVADATSTRRRRSFGSEIAIAVGATRAHLGTLLDLCNRLLHRRMRQVLMMSLSKLITTKANTIRMQVLAFVFETLISDVNHLPLSTIPPSPEAKNAREDCTPAGVAIGRRWKAPPGVGVLSRSVHRDPSGAFASRRRAALCGAAECTGARQDGIGAIAGLVWRRPLHAGGESRSPLISERGSRRRLFAKRVTLHLVRIKLGLRVYY
ncbi:hypothetical protein R5R35_002417 [Gryllus longicercus]|uniref:Uncharacterized protein n=1 Tax=Gryllus longicercus TaxID=2509291 RepID=A0AAN9W0A1_9ORTH